jgi:hypothetical protein
VRTALLLLAFALPLLSQEQKTIFPTDTRPLSQSEDQQIIQTICPGHTEKSGKVDCGKNCPSAGAMEYMDWSLDRITLGHFLSPTSDDAVISTQGCEPHALNFGGSILLTRPSGRWEMEWYKAGVETSNCHKVQLSDGREILVCLGDYGGQGNVLTDLYVEDLLSPHTSQMAAHWHFFQIFDNFGTCGENFENESEPFPVRRTSIEKVEFTERALSITFKFGKLITTPERVKTCVDNQISATPKKAAALIPRTQRYRMDFLFDGQNHQPTPSSAALPLRSDIHFHPHCYAERNGKHSRRCLF